MSQSFFLNVDHRVAIGPHEEHGSASIDPPASISNRPRKTKGPLFECLESFLAPYYRFMKNLKRHPTCPHPSSCVGYTMKVSSFDKDIENKLTHPYIHTI